MKRIWRSLCGLILLGLGVTDVLTASPVRKLPDFVFPVLPSNGMYFDPAQSGTGLGVEVFPVNGRMFFFGAFYHYDPNGVPTWLTFQSFVEQAPMGEYEQTGVPARIGGPWIVSTGGPCFDCAYHAPTTTATAFERTIQVVGGRRLRMPASGNATAIKLQRTDDVINEGQGTSRILLDSATLWSVTGREARFDGVVSRPNGWLRFRQRPAGEAKLVFNGAGSVGGGTIINAIPAPLAVATTVINAATHYEAECVRFSNFPCVWFSESTVPVAPSEPSRNEATFLVDPGVAPGDQKLRMVARCTSSNPGPCPTTGGFPSLLTGMGDVIETAPDAAGNARLLIRYFALTNEAGYGGWTGEYELTRVSPAHVAEVFPNGVP